MQKFIINNIALKIFHLKFCSQSSFHLRSEDLNSGPHICITYQAASSGQVGFFVVVFNIL